MDSPPRSWKLSRIGLRSCLKHAFTKPLESGPSNAFYCFVGRLLVSVIYSSKR